MGLHRMSHPTAVRLPLADVVVFGFFAAGAGRLLAKDTLLREPRNRLLRDVCKVRTTKRPMREIDDLAELCRRGVGPLETHEDVEVSAPSFRRAKLAEGVTCPSCVAWHCVVWARLLVDRRGVWSARWWVDTFAAWGLASVLTRVGG